MTSVMRIQPETTSTPMGESIRLALLAKNLNYEAIDAKNTPGVLQRNANDSKGYIATLEIIGQELGVSPLGASDMQLLEYFVSHVYPTFVKTVTHNHAREGLDLFIEAIAHLENSLLPPYFGGSSPNLVDYGLFPWFNKMLPSVRQCEAPQLKNWLKRMKSDSIVQKVAEAAFNPNQLKQFNESNQERTLA